MKTLSAFVTQNCRQPRPNLDDELLSLLARFGELWDGSGRLESNALASEFLRWALEGRKQTVVAFARGRAAKDSTKALEAIHRAATKPEPIGYSFVTGYAVLLHRHQFGWLRQF